jgi:hypothetical protein
MEGGVPEEVAVSEAEKTKLPEGVKKLRDASEQADKAGAKGTLAAATGEPAGMLKFLKQKLPMTGEEALEEIKAIDERRAKELALPKVTEEEHLKNLALGEELLFQQMQRGAAGEESPLTKRLNLAREARLKKEQLEQQRSEQLEREATPEYKAMKKEEREREALIHELEEQKKDTNLAHLRAAREAAIEVLGKEGARKLEDVGEEAKPHLEAEKQRNPEVSTLIWEVSDSPGAEYKSAATVRAMKAVIAETVVDAYGRLHSELKKAGAKSKEGAKMMAELEDRLFPSIFKRTEGEERREIRLQVMELAKNATRADETPVTELVEFCGCGKGFTKEGGNSKRTSS